MDKHLKHYGVKGMKWGQHIMLAQQEYKKQDVAKKTHHVLGAGIKLHDLIKTRKYNNTIDLSRLTNEQLQKVVTRKKLETKYLDAIDPVSQHSGMQIADTALELVGAVATASAGIYGVAKVLDKTAKR